MRYTIPILLSMIFCLGCSTKVSKESLSKLNGYWEIEKVVFQDGKVKEYTMNPLIDYFELKDLQGFRKKVSPKFDGTYDTSNDAEPFKIIENNAVFQISYSNDLSEWQETLTSLKENSFVVVNEDGLAYHYKRFVPINIQKP